MPKSNVSKQMVLNFLCKNVQVSQPVQLYLGLFSTNPTDSGTGIEVSYSGYARQSVSFGAPQIVDSAAVVANTNIITFGVVPTSAGQASFAGLYDSASGGNLIYHGALSASYALGSGVQPIVPVGALQVSET